ncbi:protein kinase [Pseudoflavonifractor phocaeensis]|uniref:serine/threonine protein kinase n=1 Tax=Pseudoflavonifractor phocaeensis TaxID=1870988 RepID=UPI0025A4C3C9|nr:protein kinase [Pseudoflavonifractor phocaeensis]MDM8238875.1 protein kinase [Pseudoflavonifractor phocaeensis]
MNKLFCPYCMSPVKPGESCPNCGLTAGSYVPSPHHLPPGTVLLDRYLVGRVLGEGGFGITYIGCDLRLELKIAIKEYYPVDRATRNASVSLGVTNFMGPAAQSFERGKQKFLGEARAMARMDKQQTIVGVRDYFEANNTAYIVMEYIQGTNFNDLVKQRGGRIAPEELFPLLEPLFGALSVMHENGLIHRDISPDNLMLEHGKVRLLDFGCARETTRGTETLTIALKQGYAPVEQYQSKGQGPWTDIYALCATIYFCLTGKAPPQALDRITADGLLLPSKLGVVLLPGQEEALLKGLNLSPNRRYRSMAELHAALYQPGIQAAAKRPEPEPLEPTVPVTPEEEPTPAPEPEPLPPEPSPEEEAKEEAPAPAQDRPAPIWKRLPLWSITAAGAALLVLVILAVAALSGGGEPAYPERDPSAVELQYSARTAQEIEALFDNAVSFTGSTEEELRTMLADESVPAVVVESGSLTIQSSELTLTKPMKVAQGANVTVQQSVTVEGDGALLIDGTVSNQGLLRTTGGGAISVSTSGVLEGRTLVWLEHESNLLVAQGGTAIMGGQTYGQAGSESRFLVLWEDGLFQNAVHVKTWGQYQTALEDRNTQAIVIDEDMTIPIGAETGGYVPILISEGVTVTTQSQVQDGFDQWDWNMDATILINRGTVKANLNFGDWDGDQVEDVCAFINYGSIQGNLFQDCIGTLVNQGEMTIRSAQIIQSNLYNLGDLSLQGVGEETFLNLFCDTACNFGSITLYGDAQGYLTLTNGLSFCNYGVITVEDGAILDNQATLNNCGTVAVQAGGHLNNMGLITGMGALELDPNSRLGHDGIIHWFGEALSFPNRTDNSGGRLIALDYNSGVRQAATQEELRSALSDGSCTLVIVPGDLTVSGDLTVTKGLQVDGTLNMDGGSLSLSGADASFWGCVDLGGGTLTLSDGAAMIAQSLEECGGITVRSQSNLVVQEPLKLESGAAVNLSDSHLTALRGYTMDQGDLSIHGVLRTMRTMELTGCTVEVEAGELHCLNAMTSLDQNTTVDVAQDGYLVLSDNEGGYLAQLNGTLTNRGTMESYTLIRLGGTLTNYGTFHFMQDIAASGTLDNQGTMLSYDGAEVSTESGGTFTGNQPKNG